MPAYGRLVERLRGAVDGAIAERLRGAWSGRTFGAWYERPVLLTTAIRDDALREGSTHPLWPALSTSEPDSDAATSAAIEAALGADRAHLWGSLATRHVQTNDPARAIAWIWPAALAAAVDPERPLALFDIGASAGLNLVADRLPPVWERDDGGSLPVDPLPPVATRAGFDLRPIDVLDEEDARWLRAAIWPGQHERAERLDSAIAAFRAAARAGEAPAIERITAADIPALLPVCERAGPRAIAYQTVMRDYLAAEERRRYEDGMRRWLRASAPGAAVWIEFEVTDEAMTGGPPVALSAHVRVGEDVRTLHLAHADPHPRFLDVDEVAAGELRAALGASR